MSTIYRYYAAQYASRKVPAYSTQCRAILAKMGAIAKLQTPLLAQTTNDLNLLDAAEQAANKAGPAATADRNAKLAAVKADMRQLKAFIQSIADADMLNAQALIESSGMSVARRTVRSKPDLAAKLGKVPGTAGLYAKAVKGRASYQWEMSIDQKTWSDLPATVKSSTSVSGLTPSTTYYFRVRNLTVAGLSDWSSVVSFIAH